MTGNGSGDHIGRADRAGRLAVICGGVALDRAAGFAVDGDRYLADDGDTLYAALRGTVVVDRVAGMEKGQSRRLPFARHGKPVSDG